MNYLIDKSTGMFVLKEFRMLGGQSEVSKAIAGKYKKPVSDGTSGSDSTSPTESGSPSPAPSEEDVVKYLQNIKVAETS
jgi:hypothetical protein